MTAAFDAEALWAKSRVFIRRALRDRDEGDFGSFLLWGALSLEVLGKAALARIHPALVADPQHQESLFAACGHSIGVDRRSVLAKTVFERLTRLHKGFDVQAHDFCKALSADRNAELHSGETPLSSADPQTRVPRFWRVASIILTAQSRTLTEWVGAEEATSLQELIAESISVLEEGVRARIRRRRTTFDQMFPRGSEPRAAVVAQNAKGGMVHWRDFGAYGLDETEPAQCPACGCDGLLGGISIHEEITDPGEPDEDGHSWLEFVTVTASSEAFRCRGCGLHLDGQDEIRAAELPDEFEVEKQREREFEEPYMDE